MFFYASALSHRAFTTTSLQPFINFPLPSTGCVLRYTFSASYVVSCICLGISVKVKEEQQHKHTTVCHLWQLFDFHYAKLLIILILRVINKKLNRPHIFTFNTFLRLTITLDCYSFTENCSDVCLYALPWSVFPFSCSSSSLSRSFILIYLHCRCLVGNPMNLHGTAKPLCKWSNVFSLSQLHCSAIPFVIWCRCH